MRRTIAAIVLAAASASAGAAMAAEPIGNWSVEDGSAIIRIDNCGGALWGVVAWERAPGRDEHNPNPSLRGRPTLGSAVLINMRGSSAAGRWSGQIYNARNGETYKANLKMEGDNTLRVEGCVMGGVFCGGQHWRRVNNAPGNSRGGQSEVCSRVSDLSGRTR